MITEKARKEIKILRDLDEITGYVLLAEDGEIGRCKDFLFDDHYWTIRHMVADTGKWLPGRKVLVSPDWIDSVDWSSSVVRVGLTREEIKNSPPYDPSTAVNREYEARLYDFYGRPKYW